jgi:hypothetical protein
MKTDLNKVYQLLSPEDQKRIDKILLEYFSVVAGELGFTLTEKTENVPAVRAEPAPQKIKKYKKRVYFPIELHGLKIPSMERLVELYQGGKGEWNGEITQPKVRYYLSKKEMTYEEIFPYPPPEENRKTLIKRKTENGDNFYPVG